MASLFIVIEMNDFFPESFGLGRPTRASDLSGREAFLLSFSDGNVKFGNTMKRPLIPASPRPRLLYQATRGKDRRRRLSSVMPDGGYRASSVVSLFPEDGFPIKDVGNDKGAAVSLCHARRLLSGIQNSLTDYEEPPHPGPLPQGEREM